MLRHVRAVRAPLRVRDGLYRLRRTLLLSANSARAAAVATHNAGTNGTATDSATTRPTDAAHFASYAAADDVR